MQILSYATPSAERLEPSLARELTRQANDTLAAAVSKHSDRFLGFATLPMLDPVAAARELERTVPDLRFVGAMINGHVNGRYLDDKFFSLVFECAEALGVPIYMHIQIPPKPVARITAVLLPKYPHFYRLPGPVGTSTMGPLDPGRRVRPLLAERCLLDGFPEWRR